MRLNAYLARAGVASRRGAEELIRAGRVRVNGEVAGLATFVEASDRVELDGRPLAPEPLAYVLLHKPAGVVTTARDPHGRPTVVDLVGHTRRVVPVGRPATGRSGRTPVSGCRADLDSFEPVHILTIQARDTALKSGCRQHAGVWPAALGALWFAGSAVGGSGWRRFSAVVRRPGAATGVPDVPRLS